MNLEREGVWTSAMITDKQVVFKSPAYRKVFTVFFGVLLISFFFQSVLYNVSYNYIWWLFIAGFSLFMVKIFNDETFNCKYKINFENNKIQVICGSCTGTYEIAQLICRENINRYPEDPKLYQLYVKTKDNKLFLVHQSYWLNRNKVFTLANKLSEILKLPVTTN